jgi:hypothetical protein
MVAPFIATQQQLYDSAQPIAYTKAWVVEDCDAKKAQTEVWVTGPA